MKIQHGAKPVDQYAKVPNAWARDARLSLDAQGLLAKILSHADGSDLSIEQLVTECADDHETVIAALKELTDIGYVQQIGERPDERMPTPDRKPGQ